MEAEGLVAEIGRVTVEYWQRKQRWTGVAGEIAE